MTKQTKYILLESDTKKWLEMEVQATIEQYEKYNWFLLKINTIITPYIIYEYWNQYTSWRYNAEIHLTYND